MSHESLAGRIGTALTRPLIPQPGDSAFVKAAKFAGMVVSPIVVGPAVLAGFAVDHTRSFGHLREISRGYGQFERTRVTPNITPLHQQFRKTHPTPQVRQPAAQPVRAALNLPAIPQHRLTKPHMKIHMRHLTGLGHQKLKQSHNVLNGLRPTTPAHGVLGHMRLQHKVHTSFARNHMTLKHR